MLLPFCAFFSVSLPLGKTSVCYRHIFHLKTQGKTQGNILLKIISTIMFLCALYRESQLIEESIQDVLDKLREHKVRDISLVSRLHHLHQTFSFGDDASEDNEPDIARCRVSIIAMLVIFSVSLPLGKASVCSRHIFHLKKTQGNILVTIV